MKSKLVVYMFSTIERYNIGFTFCCQVGEANSCISLNRRLNVIEQCDQRINSSLVYHVTIIARNPINLCFMHDNKCFARQ